MVRIGLVLVALVLLVLVITGVGSGLGYIQIDKHGVSLVHKDDASDAPVGEQSRVVSADDLLKQKGVTYTEPTPAVDAAAKPAESGVAQSSPPAAPVPTKVETPAAPDKPAVAAAAVIPVAQPVQASAHETAPAQPKPPVVADNQVVKIPLRISAGNVATIKDPRGNVWEADSGFVSDKIVNRGPIAIANTDFPDVYRTEHYEMTGWNKRVPNGKYLVNLHFAETSDHVNDAHPRVFHVNVQGNELRDLNVAKEAGGNCKALIKTFHAKVTDGKLAITFQKANTDDGPEINGIEVLPDDQRVTLRIDAGSPTPVRDPRGNVWEAESGFEGGKIIDRGPIAIANTDFPDVYRTEHYDMTGWSKTVPNGKYIVNLHFAETWDGITDSHQRIFHVIVQGAELRDINVAKETGGLRRALVKTFHANVTDGRLAIQFHPTGDNVPEINGIEVIPEN